MTRSEWIRNKSFHLSMLGVGVVMGLAFPVVMGPFFGLSGTRLTWFFLPCLGAGLAVGEINYWIGKRLLLIPLRHLHSVAQRAKSGDFSMDWTMPGSVGEIQQTSRDMGDLHHEIQLLLADVLNASQQVRDFVERISQAVQILSDSSQEVTHDIQQVSQSAEKQADFSGRVQQGVGELAAKLENMLGSISQVTTVLAGESATIARQGNTAIVQVTKEIEAILGAVQHTVQEVQSLDRESQQIGKIVEVITQITSRPTCSPSTRPSKPRAPGNRDAGLPWWPRKSGGWPINRTMPPSRFRKSSLKTSARSNSFCAACRGTRRA